MKPMTMDEGYAYQIEFASTYYRDLLSHCLSGLKRTLNPATGLYDLQIRNGRIDKTIGSEHFTSTCICLIGIDRAGVDPQSVGLDPLDTLEAATELARRNGYVRQAGLLIWANAVLDGEDFSSLYARINLRCDERFMDTLTTMELAWLASGLLHEVERSQSSGVLKIAEAACQALRARYNPASGLMWHAGAAAPWRDRLRRNIPNFADQIYALQALSFCSLVLEDREALAIACRLGSRLVERQGPLGQWWWHYDARSGTVAEPFPVYSVHQHAMAPMAFFALRAAGGPDYAIPVATGQSWIARNEAGRTLVDADAGTVWRDIERTEPLLGSLARKARHLLASTKHAPSAPRPETLKVNRETRPYEWAWCLYAGAIKDRLVAGSHIV